MNGRTAAVWKKVKSQFGYGLHSIADTHHEVQVAFEVARASASEFKVLSGMLKALFTRAPEMADRCADFSADRGLDNACPKAQLWDRLTKHPLIDTRLMRRVEKQETGHDPERSITRALFSDRANVIGHVR